MGLPRPRRQAKILQLLIISIATLLLAGFTWKARLSTELRTEAMEKVQDFAKEFAGSPLAKEAEKLVRKTTADTDPHAWIAGTLQFVGHGLEQFRPNDRNRVVREKLLRIFDYPVHVDPGMKGEDAALDLAWRSACIDFGNTAMDKAIAEIKAAKVTKGASIWKLYNMGFVVKGPKTTIGFDVIPSIPLLPRKFDPTESPLERAKWFKPDERAAARRKDLAGILDVLLITHMHGDHIDSALKTEMLKLGKTVIMPEEGVASEAETASRGKTRPAQQDVDLSKQIGMHDHQAWMDVAGIKVRSYPGYQDKMQNNIYVVVVDGVVVAHNGDNYRGDGSHHGFYKAITDIDADVALAACWSGFGPFVVATKAKLMITGHENELGHSVSHRESFMETFGYLNGRKSPGKVMIMNWGERIALP